MGQTDPETPAAVPAAEKVPGGWVHLAALAGLTVLGLYFCYRIAQPFLPALAWAAALAAVAHPVHRWVSRRVSTPLWAAVASTFLVLAVLVVPTLLVAARLAEEAAGFGRRAGQMVEGGWREAVRQVPPADRVVTQLEPHVDPEAEARKLVGVLSQGLGGAVSGVAYGAIQFLVMVFVLFFLFKDQDHILAGVRALLPVTRAEADHLFARADDAIQATVYATVVTGLLQGATGGLLFWLLGVPAPLLWGVVMFVLSVIPVLGAFVVWVPVAVGLALGGQVWQAGVIVLWGVLMAGPICNWVYAYVAGDRLRLHPVPALVAFIGGLAIFGVSGMVLGPVVLALTLALVDMWRRREVPGPSPAAAAGKG